MKKITVLGSTGSVGGQTLDVAEFTGAEVVAMTAGTNYKKAEAQARKFKPELCVMADENAAKELKISLADTDIKVTGGENAVLEAAVYEKSDIIFNSISGFAGLRPTLAAIGAGKTLALANKESIVMAGERVISLAKEKNVTILPVDSEHCAIHQCLRCGEHKEVSRLILTASGGPFKGKTLEQMKNVTPEEALGHPTWNMGRRITVDSATMLNKGFEIIEARFLFDIPYDRIDVLVHPQSIIHSMVEYNDYSVMAQLSNPDMRLCSQYCLTYPDRVEGPMKQLRLEDVMTLTFTKPDETDFPMLSLAKYCLSKGGIIPAMLNAADEVAVKYFLDGKLKFTDIQEVCRAVVYEAENIASPSVDELFEACKYATERAVFHSETLSAHPFMYN